MARNSGREDRSGAHLEGEQPGTPLRKNVATISALEEAALQERSSAERLAERITSLTGTGWFALLHVAWFAAWALINVGLIRGVQPFDPFPFSFLTLIVSLEAIFLSIFVLISQNHTAFRAERRAHLDLQINLLAEQESTETLALVRRIADQVGVRGESPARQDELAQPTDVRELAKDLTEELPGP